MAFDLGDLVPLTVDVRDAAGALTAATGVALTITLPNGSTVAGTVTNPSLGRYQCDYAPAVAGRYVARWTSTAPATAYVDQFDVRPSQPGWIVSLTDAKQHLNLTTTTHDEELRGWLDAATAIVESVSGRVAARRTIVERHDVGRPVCELALFGVPAVSVVTIVDLDGLTVYDPAAYDVAPSGVLSARWMSASYSGLPLRGRVQVTYVAGPEVVRPGDVGAAKIIVKHLWDTQRSGVGGSRRTAVGGQVSGDDDMMVVAGYAVPAAAVELIGSRVIGFA